MEVVREIELDAAPEEVWRSLTEPERLAEWFANEVELDVRPGGEGRFRWEDGDERVATVDRVEPGELFSFRWRGDGRAGETVVAISLEPVEAGTRVRVVESTPEWSLALELRACALALAAR